MKNKLLLLLATIFLVLGVGFSYYKFDVSPSSVTFNFNKEHVELDERFQIFNYQNYTYVPIRFIAENLDADIKYDSINKVIDIHYASDILKSKVNSSIIEDSFKLSIYSEESTYEKGNTLRLWADLENIGEDTINIYHADPLLHFQIIEQNYQGIGETVETIELRYQFEPNNEYSRQMPLSLISEYNLVKENPEIEPMNIIGGGKLYNNLLNEHPKPFHLPTGSYHIRVVAEFSEGINKDVTKLSTEIPIEVK